MSKVVFLRLRNRTLNKFKATKPKKPAKRLAKKTISKKIKKTLRVVAVRKPSPVQKIVPATGKASPQQKQVSKAPSPVAKHSPVPKIGARTLSSLIGHRRLFLRNRRLMELNHQHRPIIAAF